MFGVVEIRRVFTYSISWGLTILKTGKDNPEFLFISQSRQNSFSLYLIRIEVITDTLITFCPQFSNAATENKFAHNKLHLDIWLWVTDFTLAHELLRRNL